MSEIYLIVGCNSWGISPGRSLNCFLPCRRLAKTAWCIHKCDQHALTFVFCVALGCTRNLLFSDYKVHPLSPFACAMALVVSTQMSQRNGMPSTPVAPTSPFPSSTACMLTAAKPSEPKCSEPLHWNVLYRDLLGRERFLPLGDLCWIINTIPRKMFIKNEEIANARRYFKWMCCFYFLTCTCTLFLLCF